MIDPGLASVLLAIAFAGLCGAPALHKAAQLRRKAKRICLSCGRKLVRGVRQCACDP